MYKCHSSVVDLCCQLYIWGLIEEVRISDVRVASVDIKKGVRDEGELLGQG